MWRVDDETASELQVLLAAAESERVLLESSLSETQEAQLVSQQDLSETQSELESTRTELEDATKRLEGVSAELAEIKVQFDPEIREGLLAAVEACSDSERSKTVEQRESDRLSACESVEPDQIEKRPDAYTGTCVTMYAVIIQFDSATGPCAFHANGSTNTIPSFKIEKVTLIRKE